jgi:hypothetical protein
MRQISYIILDLTRAFQAQLELLVFWIFWTGILYIPSLSPTSWAQPPIHLGYETLVRCSR